MTTQQNNTREIYENDDVIVAIWKLMSDRVRRSLKEITQALTHCDYSDVQIAQAVLDLDKLNWFVHARLGMKHLYALRKDIAKPDQVGLVNIKNQVTAIDKKMAELVEQELQKQGEIDDSPRLDLKIVKGASLTSYLMEIMKDGRFYTSAQLRNMVQHLGFKEMSVLSALQNAFITYRVVDRIRVKKAFVYVMKPGSRAPVRHSDRYGIMRRMEEKDKQRAQTKTKAAQNTANNQPSPVKENKPMSETSKPAEALTPAADAPEAKQSLLDIDKALIAVRENDSVYTLILKSMLQWAILKKSLDLKVTFIQLIQQLKASPEAVQYALNILVGEKLIIGNPHSSGVSLNASEQEKIIETLTVLDGNPSIVLTVSAEKQLLEIEKSALVLDEGDVAEMAVLKTLISICKQFKRLNAAVAEPEWLHGMLLKETPLTLDRIAEGLNNLHKLGFLGYEKDCITLNSDKSKEILQFFIEGEASARERKARLMAEKLRAEKAEADARAAKVAEEAKKAAEKTGQPRPQLVPEPQKDKPDLILTGIAIKDAFFTYEECCDIYNFFAYRMADISAQNAANKKPTTKLEMSMKFKIAHIELSYEEIVQIVNRIGSQMKVN